MIFLNIKDNGIIKFQIDLTYCHLKNDSAAKEKNCRNLDFFETILTILMIIKDKGIFEIKSQSGLLSSSEKLVFDDSPLFTCRRT